MVDILPSPINGYYSPQDKGEPGREQPRLSISDQEGRIISELVRGLNVIEIGTGLGVSTKWLASKAQHVYTCDIDPWVQENIWPTLPTNVECSSTLVNIYIEKADAAFIDGRHEYAFVMADIATVKELVKPGGLLIFHDLYLPDVIRALSDSAIEFMHIQSGGGIAVAWNQ